MTSITIQGLSVAYGGNAVLDGLELSIRDGEFFTLLGPSGCGKTTLLRTIAGFIAPAAGSISFGETAVTALPTHRRDIGMVFQDYALFPDRSVNANVAYGLKARKESRERITSRVAEALDRVGMAGFGERMPGALSGGQRQRVALARALVIRPKVLLMDEPLSNLDTKLRVQVREAIGDLQHELGITTVFVTHDQEEALALSDRMAVFRAGTIEQLGSPSEIYQNPVSTYTADFIGAANVLRISVPAGRSYAAGATAEVALAGAPLTGIARTQLSPGAAFAVARPEALQVVAPHTGQSGDATLISAEVVRRQYLGSRQVHTARISEAQEIQISGPASVSGFDVGSAVQIRFPHADTLVMAS